MINRSKRFAEMERTRREIGVPDVICVRVPQGFRQGGNFVPIIGYQPSRVKEYYR